MELSFKRIVVQAAVLCLALVLPACSKSATTSSSQTAVSDSKNASAVVYPPGLVAPLTSADAFHAGVYTSESEQDCCFLGKSVSLILDVTEKSKSATFKFYVPDNSVYRRASPRATFTFDGARAASSYSVGEAGKIASVRVDIPTNVSGRVPLKIGFSPTFVPKSLGMNADGRTLSVILLGVTYD